MPAAPSNSLDIEPDASKSSYLLVPAQSCSESCFGCVRRLEVGNEPCGFLTALRIAEEVGF